MNEPGMISLAGGLPHPSLFPFSQVNAQIYAPDADLQSDDAASSPINIHVPKHASSSQTNTLSAALQYGSSYGSSTLSSFIREFTARVMTPGYSDFEILLNSGNTDAWNKVVNILCEFGDYILVEEHTYPSSQAVWAPMGCRGVPVPIDKDGLVPEALEAVLENWNETHPGVKRPHLLYTVPVGQNPTSATLSPERKKAVYDICVVYDVIICEDDPYYFLSFPPYVLPAQRQSLRKNGGISGANETPLDDGTILESSVFDEQALIDGLIPTFLSFDVQGRVVRLDTFSKTLGPGNRLGYFVCNPLFTERLLRATEVTTQAPSGWSQALVEELLLSWGQGGFLRWMVGLRDSYTARRDWMCDIIAENFDVLLSPEGIVDDVVAVRKSHGSTKDAVPFFSFSFPRGGMFLWIKIYLSNNVAYQDMKVANASSSDSTVTAMWTEAFWMDLIKEKVLLTPGSYYTPIVGMGKRMPQEPGVTFFRLAFSFESREEMKLGIERMTKVFERWWPVM